jgi:hypothetical protein
MWKSKSENKRMEIKQAAIFLKKLGVDLYTMNLPELTGPHAPEYHKHIEDLVVRPEVESDKILLHITGAYVYNAAFTGNRRADGSPIAGDVCKETIDEKVYLK